MCLAGSAIDNNVFGTIKSASGYANGVNLGATLQGSVSGNQFSLIEAGTDKNANGIYVAGDVLSGSAIDNNVFGTIKSTSGNANGVNLGATLQGSVSGNQFSLIEAGTDKNADGIYVDGDVLTGSAIDNNVFGTIKSASGYANGVNLGATLQGSVSGNQFSLIEAGTDKNANGINVAGDVLSGSAIDNNVFGTIKSTSGNANGVNLGATLQGSVSGNQFSLIEAGTDKNADGIYVDGDVLGWQRD